MPVQARSICSTSHHSASCFKKAIESRFGAKRQLPQVNPQNDDSLSQRKAATLQKLDWVRNSRI